VTLVMLWTDEYRLKQVLVWTVGSAEGRTWSDIGLALPPIALGTALLAMRHRHLDALSLGDEHALSVGVPVGRERMLLLLLCALVSGAAVSVAGTIGFVGLIVPHIVRLVVGPRARVLLLASFLVGGGFLVVCDLIARLVSGAQREYPVGIVTSLFGVPFFLWLLQRSKRSLA
jgi:iron complex transport system permease protein